MIPFRISYFLAAFLVFQSMQVLVSKAQEIKQVELRFVSFPKVPDPAPFELQIGDGEVIEVEAPTNSLSKPYLVKPMTSWTLGESTVNPDGDPSFKVFGQVKSIAAKQQIILVIRKGKTNDDGLTLIPIDARVENFGGGRCLLMNASKVDIAGEIGGKKFMLKPGKRALLAPGVSNQKNGRKYSSAKIFFRKNEKAEPFFSSVWRLNAKARSMVFVYHEPLNRRLRLHIIRDYL